MRHLLACLAILAAFNAGAQSTMPWNPDANDDSYIGATDMLSTLAVYGQQFGIDSSLTCDYDGTPIEEFFGNVWNGDIIIDSILVQYHTIDSAEVYIAGCPDPVWETVSYERAWTTGGFWVSSGSSVWYVWYGSINGQQREFKLSYIGHNGLFEFRIRDYEVINPDLSDVLGTWDCTPRIEENGSNDWAIPFPTDAASMDENGIHFEYWTGFLSGATYVNILPYWHYAE